MDNDIISRLKKDKGEMAIPIILGIILNIVKFVDDAAGEGYILQDSTGAEMDPADSASDLWDALDRPENMHDELKALFVALSGAA